MKLYYYDIALLFKDPCSIKIALKYKDKVTWTINVWQIITSIDILLNICLLLSLIA